MYFIFVLKWINATVERASSEKRTYNMQCTIFTDTSLSFILLQTRFWTNSAQNVQGENIYAVGIEIVWALHWNILFFLSALRFSSLYSRACVVPSESGRQQHKIFSVWIWMYCIYWGKRILKLNSNEFSRRRMKLYFSIPTLIFRNSSKPRLFFGFSEAPRNVALQIFPSSLRLFVRTT